ncbi:MAG: PUR family DNA/RNA-binding protein [Treponema sp.]|nr:PUR family DNA/RNA-binding protein [Treponema sp.]
MGARGELFTTQIYLDNRSYFFNVKENRTGDVFLQIVESKNRDGAEQDRHQIAIFADDMQKFLQGLNKSLDFVEKDRKQRQKAAKEKKAAKEAKYGASKKKYVVKSEKKSEPVKKTGRIHVVSKRPSTEDNSN